MKDYAKLKQLLEEQETFPHLFTFKFIGRNTGAFALSVGKLEQRFPALQHTQSRESGGGKHVAKTYVLNAPDADAVIEVYRAIEGLEELVIVL